MIVPSARPCQSGIEAPVQLNTAPAEAFCPTYCAPGDLPAVNVYRGSFVAGAIELFKKGDEIIDTLLVLEPGKIILVPGTFAFGSLMYSRNVASSQVIPEFLFAGE